MTSDQHVLCLKSFPCLPNDVVNQKIIKSRLGCNLPFFPSAWLPQLLARNSVICIASSTLITLDNSGTSS